MNVWRFTTCEINNVHRVPYIGKRTFQFIKCVIIDLSIHPRHYIIAWRDALLQSLDGLSIEAIDDMRHSLPGQNEIR